VESYWIVANILHRGGNVYLETARYNYGPLWSYILYGLFLISGKEPADFRFLIAIFLTIVDGAIFLILLKTFGKRVAFLFFLNPISIIITGYHNQFDNLAMLFGFISIIIFGRDFTSGINKRKTAGLIMLGISIMTKQILFFFPLWLAVKQKGIVWKIVILFVPTVIFFSSFIPFISFQEARTFEFNIFRDFDSLKSRLPEDKFNAILYLKDNNARFSHEELKDSLSKVTFTEDEIKSVEKITGNGIIQNVFLYKVNIFKSGPFCNTVMPQVIFKAIPLPVAAKIIFLFSLCSGAFIFRKKDGMESLLFYMLLIVIFIPSIVTQYLVIAVPFISVYPGVFYYLYTICSTIILLVSPTELNIEALKPFVPKTLLWEYSDYGVFDFPVFFLFSGLIFMYFKEHILKHIINIKNYFKEECLHQLKGGQ